MKYAVNLADLTKFAQKGQLNPVMLLVRPVMSRYPINLNGKRWDEVIVPLECGEERASSIVGVIRLKVKKFELRMYRSKNGVGGWKRI